MDQSFLENELIRIYLANYYKPLFAEPYLDPSLDLHMVHIL